MADRPWTPAEIELHIIRVTDELDEKTNLLAQQETLAAEAQDAADLALAQARIRIGDDAAYKGVKLTVQEKQDAALVECAPLVSKASVEQAKLQGFKAQVRTLMVQADAWRTISASTRSSMNLS